MRICRYHTCDDLSSQIEKSNAKHPTRLVAVDGKHPRLIISGGLSGTVKYATLSYYWGGLDILTLMKSNVAELQNCIR